jgi:ubiquinone biosynthesis protein
MANPLDDLKRFHEIKNVVINHGFGYLFDNTSLGKIPGLKFLVHADADKGLPAEVRARKILEELGPTFVKLGQLLSTRPDIMPEEYIEEFKKLQNDVPPLPADEILTTIERYLGLPVGEVFEQFEKEPLASASIAQVHRAKLSIEGSMVDVVCKIQRPGIEKTMASDLNIIYYIARILEGSIEEVGLYSPVDIVCEFETALMQELDFLNEARNLQRVVDNFRELPDLLQAPVVYRKYSNKRLLIMSFVEGIRITDVVGNSEYDAEVLLRKVLDIVFKMVFEDGFFHADPHPGNILVTVDGRVGMIDFGQMGNLTPAQQENLVMLIMAVGLKNPNSLSNLILKVGRVGPGVDRQGFEAELSRLMDSYVGLELSEISSEKFIRESLDVAARYQVKLPANYALLARAASTVEGIGRIVYPDLNIVSVAQPYLKKMVFKRFSFDNLGPEMIGLFFGFSQFVTEVPTQIGQLLSDLSEGRFKIAIKGEELEEFVSSQRTHNLRLVIIIASAALLLTAAITIAPFKYIYEGIPVVPAASMLLIGTLLGGLGLTYLLPRGLQKISLRKLLFWRRTR